MTLTLPRTRGELLSGGQTSLGRDLGSLRERVAGQIVLPDERDWDDARQAWNLAVDQRPAAVALVASVEDVVEVVEFARAHGLRVAAQGTGHGACSLPALDETILVKTSRLRGVEIDAESRRARVEAGAIWADVVEPAAEQGFVVLHGSSPDVGVVGYTLGGGMGWLARRRGLAANSVTAVELVTADGRLVRADRDNEPDLFWAVRGGGGNFGVVTAIEIALYEEPELYAGAMFWPAERAGEVLRAWRDWVETVPDAVTSVSRILHFPPIPDIPEPLRGGSFALVEAVYAGPESEGAALLAPLRELEPAIDTFAAVAPTALQHLHMDPPGPVPGLGDGMFLDDLPAEAVDAVVATGVPPLLSVEIRHLGGALAEPSPEHGAVGSIDAEYVMFAAGLAMTPEMAAAVDDAVTRSKEALAPFESERTYFNFSERPVDAARLYPARTYRRLRRIRAAYDPGELLVSNHPIPPLAPARHVRGIGRPRSSSLGTLAVVCLATAMLMLDIAVVNTALPSIASDLHSGLTGLQWIVDAYTLALATVVLTTGSLADRFGRRRIFAWGMGLFTATSLVCASTSSIVVLDGTRAVQGLGAAMMFASSLAILTDAFPAAGDRAKAFAAYGATIGASFAVGPLVGGALTSGISWRAVFYVNLPLGLAALAGTFLWVRESHDPAARKVDWAGQATLTGGVFLLVLALLRGNADGWASATIGGELAGAGALLGLFVLAQRRTREPMLPLGLFRRRDFGAAQLAAFAISASFFALFFYTTLYLQEVLHLSPIQAGLVYLPGTMLMLVVSGASAPLMNRVAPGRLIVSGLALAAAGLALMILAGVHSSWTALLPGELVVCLGTGLLNPALAAVAMGSLPEEQSGLAAGVNSAFRQGGVSVGIAAFGALVPASAALGHGSAQSYVDALHTALLVGAALAAAGAAVCARLLANRREASPSPGLAAQAAPELG